MKKELEVLCKIEEPEKEVWKKVKAIYHSKFKDTYFNYPDICLRIRETDGTPLLTYKKDVYKNRKWLYSKELETFVGEEMKTILEKIGFKPTVEIEMTKAFCKNGIEIQKVKGLGLFLEAEGKNRREIWQRIKKTGIKVSKELNKGKPQMMWERDGNVQEVKNGENIWSFETRLLEKRN